MIRKSFILFFALLTITLYGVAQNADINLLKSINPEIRNTRYWQTTSDVTYVTSAAIPVSVLLAGIIKNDPSLKKKSLEIIETLAVELIVTETLKFSFNRNRPAQSYPLEIFPYKNYNGRSFPSGHTSMAFATAASLSIQFKKWYVTVPAFLWAGSVGYSRMYLGVHYPSDVLTGAAVGVGSAYATHWLNKKIFGSDNSNKPSVVAIF